MNGSLDTVVFDLGGVLADWDPRHLYRRLIADETEREAFLTHVCHPRWNALQDAGRDLDAATREKTDEFPHLAELIRAYYGRWEEMLAGPIAGSVEILDRLARQDVPLFALSNWSAQTFPVARRRFGFLDLFRGIVISGEEGVVKPDPAIFRILLDRYGLDAAACVFIDDAPANAQAAARLGFDAILFRTPDQLRVELARRGFDVASDSQADR